MIARTILLLLVMLALAGCQHSTKGPDRAEIQTLAAERGRLVTEMNSIAAAASRPWPEATRRKRLHLRERIREINARLKRVGDPIGTGLRGPAAGGEPPMDEEDFEPVSSLPPSKRTGAGSRKAGREPSQVK